MTTLAQLERRIFDELKNTASTAVRDAVLSSVDYYKATKFWFNEGVATFTASTSLGAYTISTVINSAFRIPGGATSSREMLVIDEVAISLNNRRYRLTRMPWKSFVDLDPSLVFGFPSNYSIHHGVLFMYPTPSQTFTCEVSGIWHFTLSACASASNVWTNEGADLIRAHAKYEFALNYLSDVAGAGNYAAFEEIMLKRLMRESAIREGGLGEDILPYF